MRGSPALCCTSAARLRAPKPASGSTRENHDENPLSILKSRSAWMIFMFHYFGDLHGVTCAMYWHNS